MIIGVLKRGQSLSHKNCGVWWMKDMEKHLKQELPHLEQKQIRNANVKKYLF